MRSPNFSAFRKRSTEVSSVLHVSFRGGKSATGIALRVEPLLGHFAHTRLQRVARFAPKAHHGALPANARAVLLVVGVLATDLEPTAPLGAILVVPAARADLQPERGARRLALRRRAARVGDLLLGRDARCQRRPPTSTRVADARRA